MIVAGDVADYREFAVGATLMDLSQRSAVELSHRRTGGIHGSHGSIPYVHSHNSCQHETSRHVDRRISRDVPSLDAGDACFNVTDGCWYT